MAASCASLDRTEFARLPSLQKRSIPVTPRGCYLGSNTPDPETAVTRGKGRLANRRAPGVIRN